MTNHTLDVLARLALVALVYSVLWWASAASMPATVNLIVIVCGTLLVFPVAWFGRVILDRHQTAVSWITTFVHVGVIICLGVPFIRAIKTHDEWSVWTLPVPTEIGWPLVAITGAAALLTVVNLALKGFGAPFFIVLSRRLAVDWMYAWTRNPMVLATLAWFLSLGIWFQSVMFLVWVVCIVAPALLSYVKEYEERELEIRFGASYLEYKARTPVLLPKRPGG
jgi:protein-S-isoprenylcysteine O-methyltransferase Ste14